MNEYCFKIIIIFSMCIQQNIVSYCIVLYLYSAQYLHVLQDLKHYMTHPTAQVQPNSQLTDFRLTGRQRLKDDYLSTSLRFFSHWG